MADYAVPPAAGVAQLGPATRLAGSAGRPERKHRPVAVPTLASPGHPRDWLTGGRDRRSGSRTCKATACAGLVSLRSSNQPTHARALRNIAQPRRVRRRPLARRPAVVRRCAGVRSGCGIRMVTRPSCVVRPAIAPWRTVRVGRIAARRRAVAVDEAQRHARGRAIARRRRNRARPSPCATATGMREPAMPRRNSDGESSTSSSARRASYCSLRLRRKRGQCSRAGDDRLELRQHLAAVADAEREACRRAAKNAANARAAPGARGSRSPSRGRRRARRHS